MDDYGGRLKAVVQHGAVGLSLAMAEEMGIVHVLCHADTPLTSTQIADKAGLKERYVRELLGSLVSGRVVELTPGTGGREGQEALYWVPREHRHSLDKTSKVSRCLSATARQFDSVTQVFQRDRPNCIRFNMYVLEVTSQLAPYKFDCLMKIFSRAPALRQNLESGIQVAELGSGKGWLMLRLAAMFPNSQFTGTDVVESPLDGARKQAEDEGLSNVSFQIVDACDPPSDWNQRFDWMLAVMTVHDLPHPQRGLEGVYRALKPGGIFHMMDECVSSYLAENVGNGGAAVQYTLSTFNCLPESYQQEDSEAVGACWGEDRAKDTIRAAGLQLLEISKAEEIGSAGVFTCRRPQRSN